MVRPLFSKKLLAGRAMRIGNRGHSECRLRQTCQSNPQYIYLPYNVRFMSESYESLGLGFKNCRLQPGDVEPLLIEWPTKAGLHREQVNTNVAYRRMDDEHRDGFFRVEQAIIYARSGMGIQCGKSVNERACTGRTCKRQSQFSITWKESIQLEVP